MKKAIILYFCFSFVLSTFAEKISVVKAKQVAKNHYFQRDNIKKTSDHLSIKLANNPEINSYYKFYVFNLGENEGYVIVSSDDAITPILAYSAYGSFDINNIAPQQKLLYDYYSECISYVQSNEVPVNEEVPVRWEKILNYKPENNGNKSITYTSPILLGDISWNQMEPYNGMCPEKNGTRTPTGCVATAMGQIMKYWNWPSTGTGSITHYNANNGGFGNITVNFAQQIYDWGAIPDVGIQENDELAKLLYHIGVSVKMKWDSDGSGASGNFATPLKNYFKYANTASQKFRYSHTDIAWINLLKTEIDAKRPLIYTGADSGSYIGHAWVCDGYQVRTEGDFFHMNWGWGPYGGNNYCTIDNLVSSATVGGGEMNFISYCDIIIGIKPNSEFVYGCQNFVTNGFEGSFNDGSYGDNYGNNLSCDYLILPNCGKSITIKFSKFDLAADDELRIYSDQDATNLVATYSANSQPSYNEIIVNTGNVLLRFITDGQNTADGWSVSYSVTTCSYEPLYYIQNSGTIVDGSEDCLYGKSQSCRWIIAPPQCDSISFSFNNFDFYSSSADRIRIYKSTQNTVSSNLLYTFKYNSLPTGTYTVATDTLLIWFNSGSSGSSNGFSMEYNAFTNTSDITNYQSNNNIKAFPNPSTCENLQFQINNINENNATASLMNILGEQIAIKNIYINNNTIFKLTDITSKSLNNGIYILAIKTKTQNNIVKFSIIK